MTSDTVLSYLAERGVISASPGARVEALGGGVSNVVLAVDADGRRLVVKQSLERLRVAEDWLAPWDRIVTEADGLELVGQLTPEVVPRVVDRDGKHGVLVIERAPNGWTDWKSRLLAGPDAADRDTARQLGVLLGTWQRATADNLGGRFADPAAFDALRIDPYYRTVARRRPDQAAIVGQYADAMIERRICFSHGDFSPKNVLTGSGDVWLIDFEVAHLGDPAFDLAFLLSHLLLKSVHRPHRASEYATLAETFTGAYATTVGQGCPEWSYVNGHVGCLLLARVEGKSPAEYLTEPQQKTARDLGAAVLAAPPDDPQQLWELCAREQERDE